MSHTCTICKENKPIAWAKPVEDRWYCIKCLDDVILSDIEKKEKKHKRQCVAYEICD